MRKLDARDLFAYVVRLRWRLLDALRAAPEATLTREMGTNHRSILRTLIHLMAVEESWIGEDLMSGPSWNWEQFQERYLPHGETLQSVIDGWRAITQQTINYLRSEPNLDRLVEVGSPDRRRTVTVEQIIYHLAGEEMIHMGEVLAMTRQQGIELPSYFLLDVMGSSDRPW